MFNFCLAHRLSIIPQNKKRTILYLTYLMLLFMPLQLLHSQWCFTACCDQSSVLLLSLRRREIGKVSKHEMPVLKVLRGKEVICRLGQEVDENMSMSLTRSCAFRFSDVGIWWVHHLCLKATLKALTREPAYF